MKIRLPQSSPLLFISALCALNLLSNTAAAETTVYRCGPQGTQYSQLPCADGQAVVLKDSRSAEQQRAAHDNAERDQALADRLRRERREDEADLAARPRAAAGIRGVPENQFSASRIDGWKKAGAGRPGHDRKQKKSKAAQPRRSGE